MRRFIFLSMMILLVILGAIVGYCIRLGWEQQHPVEPEVIYIPSGEYIITFEWSGNQVQTENISIFPIGEVH